jgi:two-component system OmpR family response regulator
MATQDHILIVDDDAEIRGLLGDYLRKNGYRVTTAANGKEMRAAMDPARPDLVILDLMLPGEDGLALCRDLRAGSNLPVIMLTARGEETDRIVGLEMGADDYVPKPFSPRELLARIKSVLRRARSLPENLAPEPAGAFLFAGWTLDIATRNLVSPGGVVIALSGTEFRLLRIFLEHPHRVLTRDQLIDLMLSRDAGPFDRAIDVQVSRLRRRLGEDGRESALIKTVRGQGYVLAADVSGTGR